MSGNAKTLKMIRALVKTKSEVFEYENLDVSEYLNEWTTDPKDAAELAEIGMVEV